MLTDVKWLRGCVLFKLCHTLLERCSLCVFLFLLKFCSIQMIFTDIKSFLTIKVLQPFPPYCDWGQLLWLHKLPFWEGCPVCLALFWKFLLCYVRMTHLINNFKGSKLWWNEWMHKLNWIIITPQDISVS